MDGHHGLRLLAGVVDALFGQHLELLLAVLVDVQHGPFGVVVSVGVLGGADLLQGVGRDHELVVDGHLAFLIGVECRAGQPDDDNDHADVDDVAAVAAGVAPGEEVHGGKQILAGLTGNHARAAEEFRQDRSEDAGGHGECDQRIEVAAVELRRLSSDSRPAQERRLRSPRAR